MPDRPPLGTAQLHFIRVVYIPKTKTSAWLWSFALWLCGVEVLIKCWSCVASPLSFDFRAYASHCEIAARQYLFRMEVILRGGVTFAKLLTVIKTFLIIPMPLATCRLLKHTGSFPEIKIVILTINTFRSLSRPKEFGLDSWILRYSTARGRTSPAKQNHLYFQNFGRLA